MFQVDVDTEKGGLTLNRDFTIDFGEEPQGKTKCYLLPVQNLDKISPKPLKF